MDSDQSYDDLAERIKLAVRQLNGTLDYTGVDKDSELIPEVAIRGTGSIFCLSPGKKQFVKVSRGIKGYIIDTVKNNIEKYLVYTWDGYLVEIYREELIFTGFDWCYLNLTFFGKVYCLLLFLGFYICHLVLNLPLSLC